MPTLGDVWDGKYFGAGEFDVTIVSKKPFISEQKGTPGIEFTFRDATGRTISERFYPATKAVFRLANLAKACGMTKDQAIQFDPTIDRNLDWFINRPCRISVGKKEGSKYHEVKEFIVSDKALPPGAPNPVAQYQADTGRSDDEPPASAYEAAAQSYDENSVPF